MSVVLKAQALSKCYAGLLAVDDFSITLQKGRIHALIGPNGAGKSTAISLLTGEVKSDTGSIYFNDQNITQLPSVSRAKSGIGHTYQITSIIGDFTVLENMWVALLAPGQTANGQQAKIGLSKPDKNPYLNEQAIQNLTQFDLDQSAGKIAGELSHGEQGRLEIAMCVATGPSVLLLDEPMSGMSLVDGQAMISVLLGLKQRMAILLVEHDMEAVFKLADQISVMASGRLIASGPPEEIRRNASVIEAYLGDSDA